MLQMLQEKTEGNRTAEESTAIEEMLHELRLTFVAVQEQPPAKPEERGAGEEVKG